MAENREMRSGNSQGLFLALSIWGIVLISVVYFFKYDVPELASNRSSQDTLYYVILGITGVAYILVQAVLGYYIYRYRSDSGVEGSYWHESHKLEMTWTIATAVILIPIVFAGLRIWGTVKAAAPEDSIIIQAMGAQFQWDFRYPGPDGEFGAIRPELYSLENYMGLDPADPASADDFIRTNQLVIPVDRPVRIVLMSKDVQHAFFLPNFRVKNDLVPGMRTDVWFVPTKVGEYEIACAELCGLGHYRMRAFLEVKTQTDYESWLAEQHSQDN